MPVRTHLTFANVASGLALVVALGGGGAAVAGATHLSKNSVGTPQLKTNAVTGAKVRNNSITGADVKESTLGPVKLALETKAVHTVRAVAEPGTTKVMYKRGSLTVQLDCIDNGSGDITSSVDITTSLDHAAFDANDDGSEYSDFLVSDGPQDIVSERDTTQDMEDGGFYALTPSGVSLNGYGFAMVHFDGSDGCLGEMTFLN